MRKELLSEPKVIEEIAKDLGVDQAHRSSGPFANVVIPVGVAMGGAVVLFTGCESGSVGPAASQTPRKCSEDPDKREYPCIGKLGEKIIGPMHITIFGFILSLSLPAIGATTVFRIEIGNTQ